MFRKKNYFHGYQIKMSYQGNIYYTVVNCIVFYFTFAAQALVIYT